MTTGVLPWTRYWVERDGSLVLDDGFLADPGEPDAAFSANPGLLATDVMLQARCVVMLGEPGMGKSTELRNHATELIDGGATVEFVDLLEFGDEGRLTDELDRLLGALLKEDRPYLLLDSLDECRRRITNVGLIVSQRLRKWENEGLFLRVACRTGDWLEALEDGLTKLYESVEIRELTPLRKRDVAVACAASGVDGDGFIGATASEGLQVFASRPWTLQLLLAEYSNTQELGGQLEVFDRALRTLLEEHDPGRRDSLSPDLGSLGRRIVVAGHVALVWLLADVRSFRLHAESQAEPTELTMSTVPLDLPGDSRVTEAEIKDLLTSALFSARGQHLFGWADRSLAEYLAAKRLVELQLPRAQLENIVFDRGSPDGRLFPQLRELAGWLIAMDHTRLRDWIDADPIGVVLSAVRLPRPELRRQVIDSLLRSADRRQLVRWWGGELRHLKHADVADQLRPRIVDPSVPEHVRSLATSIAEACETAELAQEFAFIAVDEAESTAIRVKAAYAAAQLSNSDQLELLLPLAMGGVQGDDDLELKGVALNACWPALLSLKQVFEVLEPLPHLIGAYWQFANYTLPNSLNRDHLPSALDFAISIEQSQFGTLVDAIVLLSLEQLDNEDVAQKLGRLMLIRAREYEPFLISPASTSTVPDLPAQRRRLLLSAMIDAADDPATDGFQIAGSRLGMVKAEDFEWLVEKTSEIEGSEQGQVAAEVAARTFDPYDQTHCDIAWNLDRSSILWTQNLQRLFQAVELDSDEADRTRSVYKRSVELRPESTEPEEDYEQTASELRVSLSSLLDAMSDGAVERFWEFNRLLSIDPETRRYGSDFAMKLTSFPGWQLLDVEQRRRVAEVAEEYVISQTSEHERWLGTNTLWRPAVAGYRALVLLLELDEPVVDQLPPGVWANWAPVVVSAPDPDTFIDDGNGTEGTGYKFPLLDRANTQAPKSVLGAFETLLSAAADDEEMYFSYSASLEQIIDRDSANVVVEVVKGEIPRRLRRQLLDILMKQAPEQGLTLVQSWLSLPGQEALWERLIDAAGSALRFQLAETWGSIWTAIIGDSAFGVDLILATSERYERPPIAVDTIGEQALGDLAGWMFEYFPPETDPDMREPHFVGAREQVAQWRNSMVSDLVSAGTDEAVLAVSKLADAFPKYHWLRSQALEAEEAALRANWSPIGPEDTVLLLSQNEVRLVQNADQLQKVVVESLGRLQDRLQGAQPEAVFLWDEGENRPKTENRLSDYVTRFLRDDLAGHSLVVNREVEVKNWWGRGAGERTDILVEAASEKRTARVVIEAKGCWNRDIYHAMASQLWKRYMRDWGTTHGVYLVGVVGHPKWNPRDVRRYGCWTDAASLEESLTQQAEHLGKAGASIATVMLDCSLAVTAADE